MSIRLDPHQPHPAGALAATLAAEGFKETPAELHQRTVCVDLTQSSETMWKGFRSTARNQIRHAEKELSTTFATVAEVPTYIAMHAAAAEDKGYETLDTGWLTTLLQTGRCLLVLSRLDDRVVGGGVFGLGGQTVHYLYGARDRAYRGPAFYAAFWEMIRHAKEQGFARFDVGGLPDDNEGVSFFKRAFGGQEVTFTEEQELVIRSMAHASWHQIRHRLMETRLV
jgi:lipid II:glycine glycyltransferase (peptidoglycan interpeptide bridge formation enzyme)